MRRRRRRFKLLFCFLVSEHLPSYQNNDDDHSNDANNYLKVNLLTLLKYCRSLGTSWLTWILLQEFQKPIKCKNFLLLLLLQRTFPTTHQFDIIRQWLENNGLQRPRFISSISLVPPLLPRSLSSSISSPPPLLPSVPSIFSPISLSHPLSFPSFLPSIRTSLVSSVLPYLKCLPIPLPSDLW